MVRCATSANYLDTPVKIRPPHFSILLPVACTGDECPIQEFVCFVPCPMQRRLLDSGGRPWNQTPFVGTSYSRRSPGMLCLSRPTRLRPVHCIAWQRFPYYRSFVKGIHRWPVDSLHKRTSNRQLRCFLFVLLVWSRCRANIRVFKTAIWWHCNEMRPSVVGTCYCAMKYSLVENNLQIDTDNT